MSELLCLDCFVAFNYSIGSRGEVTRSKIISSGVMSVIKMTIASIESYDYSLLSGTLYTTYHHHYYQQEEAIQ